MWCATVWRTLTTSLFLLSVLPLKAQMDSTLFTSRYAIDSTAVGELRLHIDNLSFFKDNEWDGEMAKGYTLPGLWLQPTVSYTPHPNIQLQAGLHALLYAGTIKYPSLMYQDLPSWKGDQYQKGTHLLPFFRTKARLGAAHIILGDIYGGSNHLLPDPLYAQELNLTADPEMGAQVLIDLKRWHFDAWINWQSFIFRGDHHSEAFCFGLSSRVSLLSTHSSMTRKGYTLTLPVSLIAQHVGGEIDTVKAVTTHFNASVGIELERQMPSSWLRKWAVEAHLVGYDQNKGEKWQVTQGWGAYAAASAQLKCGVGLKAGYMYNHDFQTLLGYSYYGTMSATKAYRYPSVINLKADWTKAFTPQYAIGARVEAFAFFADQNTFNLSFGVFFRATPSFRLKKFK